MIIAICIGLGIALVVVPLAVLALCAYVMALRDIAYDLPGALE